MILIDAGSGRECQKDSSPSSNSSLNAYNAHTHRSCGVGHR